GWGLGGGYSLKTAINHANQVKACVLHYGMPELDVQKLKLLSCQVLGIFGTNDQLIDTSLVKKFETQMQLAQKKLIVCYYPVAYGFINPINNTFSAEFTKQALNKSVQYINKHLNLKY
ncbi:MAG: dienelactone hydrolase family protein, partial [Bacteroidetes bacterium]